MDRDGIANRDTNKVKIPKHFPVSATPAKSQEGSKVRLIWWQK
tara:strand:+ start:9 stop:137 length:129 start_codon:yes stop_codon:yes gene_type:complete